uniref:Putative methyltransferase n=1 Tax=viral metagenome TaxID=1070528 RepID=A0A6H1ZK01_9ZZZZ
MIYDEQIETQPMGDRRVLDYLEAKNYHRCLDIGGVHRPWASKFVTTYVDMITFEKWKLRYPDMYEPFPEVWESKLILGDCEDEVVWNELKEDVDLNGRYDFIISTQTIEHLTRPGDLLKRLPGIADEGYIGVPSKYVELGRGREFEDEGLSRCGMTGHYRGCFPHRWIFTIKNKVLWGFPKLSAIESMYFGPLEQKLKHYQPMEWGTLGFMWKNDIPVRIINDLDIDFPNPQTAIELYRKELSEGL